MTDAISRPQRIGTCASPSSVGFDLLDGRSFAVRVWRPNETAVVIAVMGALDASTVHRARRVVLPRLTSMAEMVVLDWSAPRFVGVAGLELFAEARHRGTVRGIKVALVDGPVCVDRALRAAAGPTQ